MSGINKSEAGVLVQLAQLGGFIRGQSLSQAERIVAYGLRAKGLVADGWRDNGVTLELTEHGWIAARRLIEFARATRSR